MTSKKGNRDFLWRINKILGGRSKHPWGDALGLKNTRIQSIFQGQVPTADALEIIHRAEKVRIDWLLTGDGPPFLVSNWLSDEQVSAILGMARQVDEQPVNLYLLTDGSGLATVVTTEPVARDYEWGAVSRFIEVTVYPYVGRQTIDALMSNGGVRVVSLDEKTFKEVSEGWKGPVHLLDGILDHYTNAEGASAASIIKEAIGRYKMPPEDEAKLLSQYRHLKNRERDAVMTVLGAMSKSYDVMQKPPGKIANPDSDSDAEDDAVVVSRQLPSADKVHSND